MDDDVSIQTEAAHSLSVAQEGAPEDTSTCRPSRKTHAPVDHACAGDALVSAIAARAAPDPERRQLRRDLEGLTLLRLPRPPPLGHARRTRGADARPDRLVAIVDDLHIPPALRWLLEGWTPRGMKRMPVRRGWAPNLNARPEAKAMAGILVNNYPDCPHE